MSCIKVKGGVRLNGDLHISGFKNSALPIIYATVLTKDVCVINNVPSISDVFITFNILKSLGAVISKIGASSYEIDTKNVEFGEAPQDFVRSMRGSYYLLGTELGRFHRAKISEIGGCNFGVRPIDQHVKAFTALGAVVNYNNKSFIMCADKLTGERICFDKISVGATINAMLACVLADGRSVLQNTAKEPHVTDTAEFLKKCGAQIYGAGSGKIIIDGVKRLHGCEYTIMPDMIECGTYLAASAALGGEVCIYGAEPLHMKSVTEKLLQMGADLEAHNDFIKIRGKRLTAVEISTSEYPGFPTDMQPQFAVLNCISRGVGYIKENVWDKRYKYADELVKMGADIRLENGRLITHGVNRLTAAYTEAADLRAGAALVIAALSADGESTISNIHLVERGYEDMWGKLNALGAYTEKCN